MTTYETPQIVASYSHSQVNHDSRWLLLELGAFGRTGMRMRIERNLIELVTPDGRLVPHATLARLRDASDLNGLQLQLASTAPSRQGWRWPRASGLARPA